MLRPLYRTLRSGLAAFGLLVILVSATPLVSWWARWLAGPWNDPKGDILIVPGADILGDGTIGGSSYWRALYAARIWHEGGFQQIVFAGGKAGSGRPVAEAMREFAEGLGVPAKVVILETGSGSTRQNALEVTRLLASLPGKKVLLTSDYHMYRAHRVFEKAGLHVEPRPFPDAIKRATGWQGRWSAFLDLSLESVKIVYYRARGWI